MIDGGPTTGLPAVPSRPKDAPDDPAGQAAAAPQPITPTPQPPTPQSPMLGRKLYRWSLRVGLARKAAVALAIAAMASAVYTYITMTGSGPTGPDPDLVIILLNVDLALILLLGALVGSRIVKAWADRRRGSAGSRLLTRLVVLFSLVAATPAIVVAVFSAIMFDLGIQSWFSERVRTALYDSLAVTSAYLREHEQVIRADALAMAKALNKEATLISDPFLLNNVLSELATKHSLPEAVIFDGWNRVRASTALNFSLRPRQIPAASVAKAAAGEVVVLTSASDERVRALVKLDGFTDTYLYVGRFVEGSVLGYVNRATDAVAAYEKLEKSSHGLQLSFFLLFGVVALLLLLAAIWIGLMFATQLARPISALIAAAERVRTGDLGARVAEGPEGDELGTLSRAFNRMTMQLQDQRRELVEANAQLDTRRRFTETVLAGVSAGVIGLDADGRIDLPNRSASELLATDVMKLRGQTLAEAIPEMALLLEESRSQPYRLVQSEVRVTRDGETRTLLVRIAAERAERKTIGYVVTFDDVTELEAAQRKAAWSDVARRIAHEIKNPLTPIQLSAERLKRKYIDEIVTDPEVFRTCTDTIIRHVDDIGRMVNEFSSFARMPAPVMGRENLNTLCREAVFLQKNANPDIEFEMNLPDEAVWLHCDGRQVNQALTNLLKNAGQSILDRLAVSAKNAEANTADQPPEAGEQGRIALTVTRQGDLKDGRVIVEVTDNGTGIPVDLKDRLTEPYVTTRAKGTGLGLAIVLKIMEDHDGELRLANRAGGGASVRMIFTAGGGAAETEDETAGVAQDADSGTPIREAQGHGA